jgi:hypothetical protein
MDFRALDARIADHVICAKTNPLTPYSTDELAAQQILNLLADAEVSVAFRPIEAGFEARVGEAIATAQTRETALCLAVLNLIERRKVTFFAQISKRTRQAFNAYHTQARPCHSSEAVSVNRESFATTAQFGR